MKENLRSKYESVRDAARRFDDWTLVDRFVEDLIKRQERGEETKAPGSFKEFIELEQPKV